MLLTDPRSDQLSSAVNEGKQAKAVITLDVRLCESL